MDEEPNRPAGPLSPDQRRIASGRPPGRRPSGPRGPLLAHSSVSVSPRRIGRPVGAAQCYSLRSLWLSSHQPSISFQNIRFRTGPFMASRVVLFALLVSIAWACRPNPRETRGMGVSATNAELMAAVPAPAAVPVAQPTLRDQVRRRIFRSIALRPACHRLSLQTKWVMPACGWTWHSWGPRARACRIRWVRCWSEPSTSSVLNSVVRSFNKNTGLQDGYSISA